MDIHVLLNLFHIFFVVPFFLWVGISRSNIPESVYAVLLALGIFITLYHGFKAYRRFLAKSSYIWVNLIHMIWIGPLLMYIGANKKDTPRSAYELLLLSGFAALGYHTYELATHYDFL